jgi:long-chain acyl-CoA synthetase
MRHLDVLHGPDRSGEVVADARLRLDCPSFRAAVSAAATTLADHGIGHGDVVATVLSNRVELVVTLFAAWDLGAALTPVNPTLTADEIAYQLADGGAKVAVVEPTTEAKVSVDAIAVDALCNGNEPAAFRRAAAPDDLALLVYTSGTTGKPKGVMLDHANVEAMTLMLLDANTLTAEDKSLLVLPLFHVNAIMLSIVTPLAVGASAYIAERFDAHAFWPLVEQERPAFFSAVPAIYFFLTILPEDIRPDVSSVRLAACGAAPMPADAITAFERRYGIPIVEGYGLSESTVALTTNPIDDRRRGTVGKPLPGVELRIVDEDLTALPIGRDGEVVARGPNIMRGYLGRPDETAAALRDGWLHTGDVGHLAAGGYLVLVDRKKDLIIRGGENISPSEVEAILQSHPTVAQAAVVGRPDPVMGEEPVAFVVAAPGHAIDETQLIDHCRTMLARFKIPRAIHELDDLPRNAVGKVTKQPLRDRLRSSLATELDR